jgi:hypothetical protein
MTDLPEPPLPPRRDLAYEPVQAPNRAGPAIAAVGGGLVLIGSFMPWASVATAFGTVSIAGTEGDGKITLVIGLVMVLLSVLELTGNVLIVGLPTRVLGLIAAFGAAGVGSYDLVNVSNNLSSVSSEFARASIGIGLYAVVGGGVTAIVGGFMDR